MKSEEMTDTKAREFPIQSERGAKPHPTSIPWWLADQAYSVYSARYGKAQSLERLAERGGFGPSEMDEFVPDWREQCSAYEALKKELENEKDRAEMFKVATIEAYQKEDKMLKELAELRAEGKLAVKELMDRAEKEKEARDMLEKVCEASQKLLERADEIQDEKDNYGPMIANQLTWLCDALTEAQKLLKDSRGGDGKS